MKILLFIDNLNSGGAQRQLVTLAKLLKAQGENVEFLVYHDLDFFEDNLRESGIIVHKILGSSLLKRSCKILSFLLKSNYDIVVSF